jgi:hypothetical protein
VDKNPAPDNLFNLFPNLINRKLAGNPSGCPG